MAAAEPQVFLHSQRHVDAVERIGEAIVRPFIYWGVAMFGLMVAAVPLFFVYVFLSRPLAAVFGQGLVDAVGHAGAAGWVFLSIPIAVLFELRRRGRIRHNRIAVDADGFELLQWPRPAVRVPWLDVRRVYDTFVPAEDPEESQGSTDLHIVTERGNFKLDSEIWPVTAIGKAMERHVTVERGRRR